MQSNNSNNNFKLLHIIRYLIRSVCLIMMSYQIIDFTLEYLSFPINVKIEVSNQKYFHLPSLTICFTKGLYYLLLVWYDFFNLYSN